MEIYQIYFTVLTDNIKFSVNHWVDVISHNYYVWLNMRDIENINCHKIHEKGIVFTYFIFGDKKYVIMFENFLVNTRKI